MGHGGEIPLFLDTHLFQKLFSELSGRTPLIRAK